MTEQVDNQNRLRVLWITNIMFPPLCERLDLPKPIMGGWMYSSVKRLLEVDSSLELAVATVYRGEELQKHEVEGVTYYLLPLKGKNNVRYCKFLEPLWQDVAVDFQPDIVHLHGTEYPHGLAFVRANPKVKAVVSIQGLVSVINRYYLGGMSFCDILRNITVRDILRGTLWQQQKEFIHRGQMECETIRMMKHVIGRTSWDWAHTHAINPEITYHFCNETLRETFYRHIWEYEKCEKYSIFLSQASYPIKGLHKVLEALPLVLNRYPQAKVYVGGDNTMQCKTLSQFIKLGGYGKYVKARIRKLHLEDKVFFLGPLNEQQICAQYLKANVFLCPSSIENSPNSLGEAQLLGVPCIASYVGGVMDMMRGAEEWMYRFEEVEMLAEKICALFGGAEYPNVRMREEARKRHSSEINTKKMISIYKSII